MGGLLLCRKPKYFHLSCLFRWQDSELHAVIKSLEYHAKSPPEILEAPLFLPLLTPELKSKGEREGGGACAVVNTMFPLPRTEAASIGSHRKIV